MPSSEHQGGRRSSVFVSSTVAQGGTGRSSMSVSSISLGGVAQGLDVRVVNGILSIDGETVPEGVSRWRARSGLVVRIRRDDGQVHVTTE